MALFNIPTPISDRNHAVAQKGREIYARTIQAEAESQHRGDFVVVDVNSSDFEINRRDIDALDRLLLRRSEAVVYICRAGYQAAYQFGSAAQPV